MRTVIYMGDDPFLIGHKALGMFVLGVFKVQVNDLSHPWAFDHHKTSILDWDFCDAFDC